MLQVTINNTTSTSCCLQVVAISHILSSQGQSYLRDSVDDVSHILANSSESYLPRHLLQ